MLLVTPVGLMVCLVLYSSAEGKGIPQLVERAVGRAVGSKLPGVGWLLLRGALAELWEGRPKAGEQSGTELEGN